MMRKAAAVFTAISCLVASQVHALGLGAISLESSLNQPLRARIEIVDLGGVSPSDIMVQMASQQDFRRFDLERTNFLSSVDFEIERTSEGVFVVLHSNQAVREPYLSFILDTRWPSGRILSEHTVLLDLPVFSESRSVAEPINQPVSPAINRQQNVVQRGASGSQQVEPADTQAEETQTAAPQPVAERTAGRNEQVISQAPGRPDSLEIQQSDTLWEIAMRVRPDSSVSVQQTMLAIQRMNPDAFVDGNINRLRAGETLQIPDLSDIQSISQQQAVSEVTRQNQQADVNVQPLTAPSSGPSSVAASSRQGQLRVLTAEEVEASSGDSAALEAENSQLDARIEALENQLVLQEEEADRVRVEQAELMSRLSDLDEQIASALEIIRLQDQQLAQLQQSLAAADDQQPQPAALVQAQPAQSSSPSFLDSILRVLSNSSMILAVVVVLVVLLMVMLLMRRNRAVTTEGFEEEFPEDLQPEGLAGGALLADDQSDDSDYDESQVAEVAALAGAALAGQALDDESFSVTDEDAADDAADIEDWDAEDEAEPELGAETETETETEAEAEQEGDVTDEMQPLTAASEAGDEVAEESVEEEVLAPASEANAESEPVADESDVDVVDFELDTHLEDEEEGAADDEDVEVLDFDIDEFLDEEEDEQSAEVAAAGESSEYDAAGVDEQESVDFELESGAEEDEDAGEAEDSALEGIDFVTGTENSDEQTDVSSKAGAAEESAESAADSEEVETLDFNLGNVGIEAFDQEEDDTDLAVEAGGSEFDSFDFNPDEPGDETGETAESAAPEQEQETETAGGEAEGDDFESFADTPAESDTDDSLADIELELDAQQEDVVGQDIEIDLEEEPEQLTQDSEEVVVELTADQEPELVSEPGVNSETTGIDLAEPAANDQQKTADSRDVQDVEEESAAGDADIELGNLDFLSADKESAIDGADEDPEYLPDDDEAATKLDLAYAYQKMGDLDGAKEILEEVINEGNDDQVVEARNLMQALHK